MPAEIAISILADITAVKNGVAVPPGMRVQPAKDAALQPLSPVCSLV